MSRQVNRRSIVLTLGALALLAAILACSISGGGPGSGVFRLDNQSGQTICYVYISPTTSSEWGDDWLGSTEVVEDGDTRDLSALGRRLRPAGRYLRRNGNFRGVRGHGSQRRLHLDRAISGTRGSLRGRGLVRTS